VDLEKLDGPLAAALASDEQPPKLPVFCRTMPSLDANARSLLKRYAISIGEDSMTVFSADLSPQQIATLSDEPWVVSLHLARGSRHLSSTGK